MRLIVHIDMDAFFASVEVRDNPSYRGRPVIIGALPGHRGVVSTASYEARKYGVHSAMPVSEAYSKCPHGIFIKPDILKYSKVSDSIMEVLSDFSPKIEQVSIDEAYIDMSGSEKLFGTPMDIISAIRDAVYKKEEISLSCGAAPNKLLAKIASDYEKPKGSTVTPMSETEAAEWLAPLPLRRLPGIGKKSSELLSKYGFNRVSDIQACGINTLKSLFGENRGAELYSLCMGYDSREVITSGMEKSISKERTYQKDEHRRSEWERTILYLSRLIARRARERKTQAMKVTLTYRLPDHSRHTRSTTLTYPVWLTEDIYKNGIKLLEKENINALRLIGIGISGFSDRYQLSFLDDEKDRRKILDLERSTDILSDKFGEDIVFRGGEIK